MHIQPSKHREAVFGKTSIDTDTDPDTEKTALSMLGEGERNKSQYLMLNTRNERCNAWTTNRGRGRGRKKLRFSSNLTIDWGEFPFAQYRSISNFKSMPLWVAPVSVCNEKP